MPLRHHKVHWTGRRGIAFIYPWPPSTPTGTLVTWHALSDARNATTAVTSSPRPADPQPVSGLARFENDDAHQHAVARHRTFPLTVAAQHHSA